MTAMRGLFLVVLVAAIAAAIAYGLERPAPTHEALRVVGVAPEAAAAGLLDAPALRTAARSQEVARDAAARASGAEPTDGTTIRAVVRARLAPGAGRTELVLAVSGASPEGALDRLDAVTAALEEWARRVVEASIVDAVAEVDAEVRAAEERIRGLQAAGTADANAEIATALAERASALDRRAAIVAAASSEPLRVDGAEVRRVARRPIERGLVAGALAALAATSVLLVTMVLRSGRHGGAAVVAGAPVVAEFPSGGPHHEARFGEAAFGLARRLAAATEGVRGRIIIVTSPEKDPSAGAIARGVAEALCRPEASTLLVDADLRAPSLAQHYEIAQQDLTEDGDGAALRPVSTTLDWLLDPTGVHEVCRVHLGPRGRLDVVPQFMPALSAAEALREGIAPVVRRWSAYDTVVIDAGPVLVHGDAQQVARHATVAVVVADEARTGRRRVAAAVRSLRRTGSTVVLALVSSTGTRLTSAAAGRERAGGVGRRTPRDRPA